MSSETFTEEIKNILLKSINQFLTTYNVDLDVETMQFCFC